MRKLIRNKFIKKKKENSWSKASLDTLLNKIDVPNLDKLKKIKKEEGRIIFLIV